MTWTALVAVGLVAGMLFGPALATAAEKATQVFVTNTASDPVPVSVVDTSQPFRSNTIIDFDSLADGALVTTVPAGKRLVIESVSWSSRSPIGDQVTLAALRAGEFGSILIYVQINPPHASLSANFTVQDGSQSVQVYFEAGEEVWLAASSTTTVGSFLNAALLGRLVNQ
jgi:hypothetical protein